MSTKPPSACVFAILSAFTAAHAHSDLEPTYHPMKARTVTIESNPRISDGSPTSDGEDCSKLRITTQDVKHYLEKASSVNPHYYSYSRCAANGKVVFENGQHGEWTITASRIGYLDTDDGRQYRLFCPDKDCRQKAFINWRGPNSENEATPGRHRARLETDWLKAKASGRHPPAINAHNLDTSYRRRGIRRLTIDEMRVSPAEIAEIPDERCDKFKLSEADVRRFLQRASAVLHPEDFPKGRCVTEGTVTFTDGTRARWSVGSSRLGNLSSEDGKVTYGLYCPDKVCTEPPYSTYRGIDSILDVPGEAPSPLPRPR